MPDSFADLGDPSPSLAIDLCLAKCLFLFVAREHPVELLGVPVCLLRQRQLPSSGHASE